MCAAEARICLGPWRLGAEYTGIMFPLYFDRLAKFTKQCQMECPLEEEGQWVNIVYELQWVRNSHVTHTTIQIRSAVHPTTHNIIRSARIQKK